MGSIDLSQVQLGVKRWTLEKFDGEHVPGDGKQPVEIIVGGEGEPTRVLTPADPDFASFVTERGGQ